MTSDKHKEKHKLYEQIWHTELVEACNEFMQSTVARRLIVSPSQLNQVLKKTYTGNIKKFRDKFLAEFKAPLVFCPANGCDIKRKMCLSNQGREPSYSNPLSIRLAKTCPTCEFNTSNL